MELCGNSLQSGSQSALAGGVGSGGRATIASQLCRHRIELSGELRGAAVLGRVQFLRPIQRRTHGSGPGWRDPVAADELIAIRTCDDGRRGPRHLRLELYVELVEANQVSCVDLVLRELIARRQSEDVQASRNLGRI